MITRYYSQCAQDEFVNKILNNKSTGFFIDIGSSHPVEMNNSYFFELLGWKGLCFDQLEVANFSQIRKSKLIVGDASQHDYDKLFIDENVPQIIDYLSLDVDEFTLKVLERIPLQSYQFKVITIEHDWYRFGDALRSEQRKILTNAGYELLCADVDGTCEGKIFFEDWWVNPCFIKQETIRTLKCDRMCFKDIVTRF